MTLEPQRLADLLPDVVAKLAARHGHTFTIPTQRRTVMSKSVTRDRTCLPAVWWSPSRQAEMAARGEVGPAIRWRHTEHGYVEPVGLSEDAVRLIEADRMETDLLAEVDRWRVQRAAVLDIHAVQVQAEDGAVCSYCRDSSEDPVAWPCPTAVAVGVQP